MTALRLALPLLLCVALSVAYNPLYQRAFPRVPSKNDQVQAGETAEESSPALPELLMMKVRARKNSFNLPPQFDRQFPKPQGFESNDDFARRIENKIALVRFLKSLELSGVDPREYYALLAALEAHEKGAGGGDRKKRVDWSDYFGVDKRSSHQNIKKETLLNSHPHFSNPNVLTGQKDAPGVVKASPAAAASSSNPQKGENEVTNKGKNKEDWISNKWFLRNLAMETNM